MNQLQARDMVRLLLNQANMGPMALDKDVIDTILNAQCQAHFAKTKSIKAYWATQVNQYQGEYNLPDGCINIDLLKVANESYYPASFPRIDEAKGTSQAVRTTDDGYTVSALEERWYWIRGGKLNIYPQPQATTAVKTTGACTCAGSTVTISSGTLGTTNGLANYLALVGSNYFVVLSNTTAAFTVDGTPDPTAVTYTVYELGMQIWGARLPTELTAGGTATIPGTDIDAMAIVTAATLQVASTIPKFSKVNISYIDELAKRWFRDAQHAETAKVRAPIFIQPFPLR